MRARTERTDRHRFGGVAGGAPVEAGLSRHHARKRGARRAIAHQVAFQRGALEHRLAQVGVKLEPWKVLRHQAVEVLALRCRPERAVEDGQRHGDAVDHLHFGQRREDALPCAGAGQVALRVGDRQPAGFVVTGQHDQRLAGRLFLELESDLDGVVEGP